MPADVTAHYSSGTLLARLNAALKDDGVNPARPTMEQLAYYDQFHGRGLEATAEMADALTVAAGDQLLDIGSGIGGPARYLARRFGCRVTGIDLTAEFCDVARHLTQLLGMQDQVRFEQGDALAMPFASATFAGAYSMNVSMNIADKAGLYREIRRVLKPGGWLVLSEVARGAGAEPDYPTPWAATRDASFLQTPDETRAGLEAGGFTIERMHDRMAETKAFGARTRALVEKGGKPPHRAVELIHGGRAAAAMANMATGLREGRLLPIEIVARA